MKYYEYIAFFIFLSGALILSYIFYKKVTLDHYYKLILRQFIKKQKDLTGEKFFSSPGIKQIVKLLLQKKDEKALEELFNGKTDAAFKSLKKHPLLQNILLAYESPTKAVANLEGLIKKQPNNHAYAIYLAKLYYVLGDKKKSEKWLERFDEKKADGYGRAVKYYYLAQNALNLGEMKEASEYASASVDGFEKAHAYYEEAKAQLLMGTIYRVSAFEDVAQFMFEAAAKIFAFIRCEDGIADIKGNLGMLMIMQNRFSDAEAYFCEALEINQTIEREKACAEIINQKALLNLLQNNIKESMKLASKALEMHKKLENPVGEAFSHDIMSYIYLRKKDYIKLIWTAEKAFKIHQKQRDTSAKMESMYLMATGYFEQEKWEEAEKLLRKMTEENKLIKNCFHIASAYNMLGLIFLRQGDLRRAKGLFYQSLSLEQNNDRLSGAATDFANIALIEKKCGQIEQAKKNLTAAIEYAEAYEETELCQKLKKELESISNIQHQK